ncbi:hypothetical protein ALC60_11012 [Trachymyrmex zeteki]|uniref:Uncharacterized protein n=1 Tax=Mycetomoellerius zeteki TaxID=64791 RepID=A0A151WPV2_9HYME|nr:hypothetical protein ALC60_11012 [Trachymyrmex zeteki]
MGHVTPYTGSNDKEGSDVSVGLWWAGTSALSIIVNRMIMRLFDGVGCASSGLLSLRSSPGATILELFDAHSIHTYGFPLLSPHIPMRVGIYERILKTTNYNASASGASGVSNEMQEVRARMVHRCNIRLRERERESMMKVEWNSEIQRKREREKERERERGSEKKEYARKN